MADGVLVNDGHARLEASNRVAIAPFPYAENEATAAFDMDCDGDLDLLVGSRLNGFQLLVGLGQGGFVRGGSMPALPVAAGTAGSFISAVDAPDVDGDGDVDLLVDLLGASGAFAECPIAPILLLNNGAGNFAMSPAALPALSFVEEKVRFFDFDADWNQDVVIAASADTGAGGGNSITVLRNNGVVGFAPLVIPANLPQPTIRGFAVGGFNTEIFDDVFISGGFGEAALLGGPTGL